MYIYNNPNIDSEIRGYMHEIFCESFPSTGIMPDFAASPADSTTGSIDDRPSKPNGVPDDVDEFADPSLDENGERRMSWQPLQSVDPDFGEVQEEVVEDGIVEDGVWDGSVVTYENENGYLIGDEGRFSLILVKEWRTILYIRPSVKYQFSHIRLYVSPLHSEDSEMQTEPGENNLQPEQDNTPLEEWEMLPPQGDELLPPEEVEQQIEEEDEGFTTAQSFWMFGTLIEDFRAACIALRSGMGDVSTKLAEAEKALREITETYLKMVRSMNLT